MILLTIEGNPTPWAAHQGYGRRAFNPRQKERNIVQMQIRHQYRGSLISGPVSVEYHFLFKVPESASKKHKAILLSDKWFHIKKPDVSNCIKFLEDCLKQVVIIDDNQVCEIHAKKRYSSTPRSIIKITPMENQDD